MGTGLANFRKRLKTATYRFYAAIFDGFDKFHPIFPQFALVGYKYNVGFTD